MFTRLLTIFLLINACLLAVQAQNGLTIKKRSEIKIPGMPAFNDADLAKMPPAAREKARNAMKHESTIYIKGSRMRTDTPYELPSGSKMEKGISSMIDQCDKKRTVSFNDKKKKYSVTNYGAAVSTVKVAAKPSSAGVINVSITGTDTGERMTLFGHPARRIKQNVTITPRGSACMQSPMSMQIDGWYADVPSFACSIKPDASQAYASGGNCDDDVRIEVKGTDVTGVPLKEVKTMSLDGKTITVIDEVVAFTETALDAAMFEPPVGYTPAGKGESLFDTTAQSYGPMESSPQSTLAPPSAGIAAAPVSAVKAPGVIRIGITTPTAEMGQGFETADTGMAVRNTLSVALKNEKTEIVVLESGLPEQEAKQKNCDYIFYSKVTRKKGGGGLFGAMGPMLAGAAAGMIPGVGGIVASVATSSVITASTLSGGFKSKDEVAFEFRVLGADGSTVIPATVTKQKAKKDGEDVLSPQIAKAAEAALAKIGNP